MTSNSTPASTLTPALTPTPTSGWTSLQLDPWLGFAAGMLLGLVDLALFWALGLQMRLGERVVTAPVMLLFGLTFGALGYAIGVLSRARAREREDARTIRDQLAQLEASQRAM